MSKYAGTLSPWTWGGSPWTPAQTEWFMAGAGTATPSEMRRLRESGTLPPLTPSEYAEVRGLMLELDLLYAIRKEEDQ